ncbi:MAG: hypothetical protein BMS9Abin01_2864 [Gammaproteobacteria bacterium]|nr:MAG: hypothetical protein BMS9Abin01_2864 [Gammaproteobacteria bacterium]
MYSLPTEPGSIGHTLDAGFKLYFVSFKQVLVLTMLAALSVSVPVVALVLAIPIFFTGDAAPGDATIAAFIIGFVSIMILYMWFYLAVLCRIGGIAYAQNLSTGACMSTALRKIIPVVLATILFSLAVMGGFLLLIIPGLILWVSMIFYSLCIVLEGDGILESLRHSHRLVWGNWWRTSVIGTVVIVVYYVIYLAIQVPFVVVDQMVFDSELGAAPGLGQAMLSTVGDIIAMVITLPLMTSVMVAVFHDLKLRKEGQDLEARVEALTASA